MEKKNNVARCLPGVRLAMLLLLALGATTARSQDATSGVFSKALLEAIEVTHLAGTCAWNTTASESFLDSATSISSYLGSAMVKEAGLDLRQFIDYQARVLTRPFLDAWLARWTLENKSTPPCDGAGRKLWEQRQNDLAAGGGVATQWTPLVETLGSDHQKNYWVTSATGCSRSRAQGIDDKRSDATMIATSAIDYCAESIGKWARAYGLDEDDEEVLDTLVELTSLYVLQIRAGERQL